MAISTAIPNNTIASAVGIEFNNKRFRQRTNTIPTRFALFAQPQTGASGFVIDEPYAISDAGQAGDVFGYGSPIHLACRVLFNSSQTITGIPLDVFPIDTGTSPNAAEGTISTTGTQTTSGTYTLSIGSSIYSFDILKDATATEAITIIKTLIDNDKNCPVTSSSIVSDEITLTAKWEDATSNDIGVSINGLGSGITITVGAMSGGSGNASVETALTNFGNNWYTAVITQFNDTTNLDYITTKGNDLWKPLNSKPFVGYYGSTENDRDALIVDTTARRDDYILSKFSVPNTTSLPLEIASSVAAYVGITSNSNPPTPYNGTPVYGILPGNPDTLWSDFEDVEYIEQGGCSPSKVADGKVTIIDLLTTYHPEGEQDNLAYRYVVNISKLQLVTYDLTRTFTSPNWLGKILVGEDVAVSNPNARKLSSFRAECCKLIDQWAVDAVIDNPDFSKSNLVVERNETNPNRVDIVIPILLSGALRQLSMSVDFSTEVIQG